MTDPAMHEHRYTYLRQEKVYLKVDPLGVSEWTVEDVFFCEVCVEYKRVRLRLEELNFLNEFCAIFAHDVD